MTKSRSRAPRTVVKKEEGESASQWIQCKALLADVWKELPALPSAESRRAWAMSHGVEPTQVHRWFRGKMDTRKRRGTLSHPQDGYTLSTEDTPAEQSSPAPLDLAPPLDNPSSPSYLLVSSPPPQTPMDLEDDLPVTITSGTLFDQDQNVNPLSLEKSHPKPRLSWVASRIIPSGVNLAIKAELVDAEPLARDQVPKGGKGRKIVLRVASDTEEGSPKRTRKNARGTKPPVKTTQRKKKRQPKKDPKTKQEEQQESLGE